MSENPAGPVLKRDLIEGLLKGLEVINAFDDEMPRLTASQLAVRLDISRAASRRYLLTLTHAGYTGTDGKAFWLTPKVLSLGHSYLASARLPRTVLPFLQRLTHQLQESTNFVVRDGDEAVYLTRVTAPRLVMAGFEPGTRLPILTSASGRVCLAALPDAELNDWLAAITLVAYTPHTTTDKARLHAELLAVRSAGYAMLEGHFEVGLRGVAVPLKSRRGVTVGAIGVSMTTSSCTPEAAIERCVPALQSTAQALMDLM